MDIACSSSESYHQVGYTYHVSGVSYPSPPFPNPCPKNLDQSTAFAFAFPLSTFLAPDVAPSLDSASSSFFSAGSIESTSSRRKGRTGADNSVFRQVGQLNRGPRISSSLVNSKTCSESLDWREIPALDGMNRADVSSSKMGSPSTAVLGSIPSLSTISKYSGVHSGVCSARISSHCSKHSAQKV